MYSSTITKWRQQRDAGALEGLTSRKRGPKGKPKDIVELKRLKLENSRMTERLENLEELMEAQGKVFALLQALDAGSDETKVPRTEMTSLRVLRLAWA